MDKIDNEIRQRLKNDKLISEKAENIFQNFLGGSYMENNIKKESKVKEENIVKKSMRLKQKVIAAMCLLALLGGGQIYASTQGYGNVFFLINYLVTRQKVEIRGKDNILLDRDITISYEPIQLTENIRMQVRNMQIKDNKAKLFLAIEENPIENDKNIIPFKYKVYNSENELICQQKSTRDKDNNEYTDQLELKKFSENDSSIKLEVYKSNDDKLSTIIIDLNTREITVEGEGEALKKISEIELKEFISYIAVFDSKIKNEQSDDYKITLSKYMIDKNNNRNNYRLTEINNMIESLGYEKISNKYKSKNYKVINSNGKDVVKVINKVSVDLAAITNINDISYNSGLYVVKFNYFQLDEEDSFDVDYTKIETRKAILYFKLNSENNYSKFKVVKYEEEGVIKNDDEQSNNEEENKENTNNSTNEIVDSANKDNEDDTKNSNNETQDNTNKDNENILDDTSNIDNTNSNKNNEIADNTDSPSKEEKVNKKQKEEVYNEIKTYIENNKKDIKNNNRFVSTAIEVTKDGKLTSRIAGEGINIFNVILDKIEDKIIKIEKMSKYDIVNYEIQNKQLLGSPKTIQFYYEDNTDTMISDMYVRWNINTPNDITFSWWGGSNTTENRTNIKFTLNTNAEKTMEEVERLFSVYPSIRK